MAMSFRDVSWRFAIAAGLAVSLAYSTCGAEADEKERASVDAKTGLFAGRTGKQRQRLIESAGGSAESEKAVAAALTWIVDHQSADGGWSFDHSQSPACNGRCSGSGSFDGRNAATAMALLPLLAAGNTNREGDHKKAVKQGLDFLIGRMKFVNKNQSFTESGGTMYSHALATIAVCEAYGMTKDKKLLPASQAAVDYIVFAQDPVGGGWRYQARQPGDMSVTSWQVSALATARGAGIEFPAATFAGVRKFLDAVQSNNGATYGYTSPGAGQATSAGGLLCRMCTGTEQDAKLLEAGIVRLNNLGPSKNNYYYNYYATQVMRHYGGKNWDRWNTKMRNDLLASQDTEGHAAGSWHVRRAITEPSARDVSTALHWRR